MRGVNGIQSVIMAIPDKFGKWSVGRFFTYAEGFIRINYYFFFASTDKASPAINY